MHTPTRARQARRRQAGFTMVLFVWLIALMSIMMGVAVQTVSFQMRREREAELIFRGEQYVEAIRLYKKRFGRNPMQLKEIWEAKPRVIRKKWKDPMTDSEVWGLVFMGQEGQRIGPNPDGTQPSTRPGSRPEEQPENRPRQAPFGGRRDQPQQMGPIVGVRSTSCEESIRTYEGRKKYCEWKFVLKDQQRRRNQPNQPPNQPPNNPPE